MFQSTTPRIHVLRRARAVSAVAGAGIVLGLLTTAATAEADVSATSPTGEVSISTLGPVQSGVATPYTLTITDVNPQPASVAGASVQLPSGMTLNRLDAACQRTNNVTLPGTAFSCGFAGLAPGASASAVFTATAAAPGTYTDQVFGQLDFGNPVTSIMSDSVNYAIPVSAGPTDIQVTGSSNNGSPPVGSQFSYTFQVKDNGPQAAYGVTFDDPLPASIGAVSVSTDNGSCTLNALSNSVHCDIGLMGVGTQSDIVVSAIAHSTGTVTNTASIAMQGPDTKPANNSVGVTVSPK